MPNGVLFDSQCTSLRAPDTEVCVGVCANASMTRLTSGDAATSKAR